ncbi:CE1759 family FMN reductase [Streptomyces sp. NPDC002265]|uniref:CE1759 family FMN reductase n=1 Tax=Streptomyces sp. NPDC002265 TaxID=3154415 RepID=UPI003324AD98
MPHSPAPLALAIVSAGTSDPSSTRLLTDRVAQKAMSILDDQGLAVTTRVIELGTLAVDMAKAIVSGLRSHRLERAIEVLAAADGVITGTPVHTAGMSGLFKSFLDLLDDDLVIAKPTLLSMTGGTSRHALVVEDQVRPMFAYLRALTTPASIFAAPDDWSPPELGRRISRAATELTALMAGRVGNTITDQAWSGYQHRFDGEATRAERKPDHGDFDTALMRLAAGGGWPPAQRDGTQT